MPQLVFTYTGQLAAAAGAAEEAIEVAPGATLRSALDFLAARHGEAYARHLFHSDGRMRSTLLVVFDGEQAAGDKESLMLDGVGTVMLMTPIAGG
ncbi:MAG: MoaD/ThiS family protein [Verrucomicrobiae bacterium]|nr:MoaD/ThiS family protein [Verrucomicrobiae bacterium]MCP5540710.1 MoaD/ThiS family protein [Akkermansiaceae bacterium]